MDNTTQHDTNLLTVHGVQVQDAGLSLRLRLDYVTRVTDDDEAPVQALVDRHEQVLVVKDVHVLQITGTKVLVVYLAGNQ